MRDKVIILSIVAVLLYLFTLSTISCKKQEPPTSTEEPTTPATTSFRVPEENLKIPEEIQACTANLQKIHAAIKKYEKDKGTLPNWLSDLVPGYISKEVFLCPNNPDRTKARYYPDPNLPCSYEYEFSPTQISRLGITGRQRKKEQLAIYGDVVPIVRCGNHSADAVLSLSTGGHVYWSTWIWERIFDTDYQIIAPDLPEQP
jgi:hypothetical protein